MRALLLALILLITSRAWGQCNCSACDSISLEKIKANWNTVKYLFTPNDLTNYTLLIEDFNPEQYKQRVELQWQAYSKKQEGNPLKDTCDMFSKNLPIGAWQHVAWIDKYYSSNKKVVNVDSISSYRADTFPYVLMFYSELEWVGLSGENSSRGGFYIWDRRRNRKYNIICAIGRRDEVWFFKNLDR